MGPASASLHQRLCFPFGEVCRNFRRVFAEILIKKVLSGLFTITSFSHEFFLSSLLSKLRLSNLEKKWTISRLFSKSQDFRLRNVTRPEPRCRCAQLAIVRAGSQMKGGNVQVMFTCGGYRPITSGKRPDPAAGAPSWRSRVLAARWRAEMFKVAEIPKPMPAVPLLFAACPPTVPASVAPASPGCLAQAQPGRR